MKPSGIEWIGDIPDDWEVRKLLSLFKEHKDRNKNLREQNLLSLSYGKIKRKDINNNDGLLPASFETYNIVENGDIVFRLTDLQNDKRSLRTGIVTQRGIITSAYVTIRPKIRLDSRFFHYLYHMYDICKVFYGMADGVRQGMGFEDLKNIPTLIPPLKTQQKIADYLDKKCGEIDATIAKQKESIEKLKAYKQSLISETVTKGLDKSAPLKPSSIEWIGDIPDDWEVRKLLSIFKEHKDRNKNLEEQNLLSLSYGKIKRKDINNNDGLLPASFETYNIVENGDIVFRLTDLQNDKRSLRTGIVTQRGIITSAYVTIRPKIRLDSRFFHYLYHMYDICKVFYGMGDGVSQGMGFEDLKNIPTLIPPLKTQQKIADYLDSKCSQIDKYITKKQNIIQKLDAYKKSLIFECVTGKCSILEEICNGRRAK